MFTNVTYQDQPNAVFFQKFKFVVPLLQLNCTMHLNNLPDAHWSVIVRTYLLLGDTSLCGSFKA